MGRSYFPNSDAKQSVWAANYMQQIESVAGQLGLTEEQVNKQKANCDKMINSISNVANGRSNLGSAIGIRNKTIATEGGSLRADISNIKTLPGYTEAIGRTLGIITNSPSVDFATFKPKMIIEMYGGLIRIKFKKLDTDGLNIYRRKKGTVDWIYLTRANKSPYDQNFVLEIPGQPELWEYRAFGVVDDNEVGVASDVVEVIYAA